MFQGLNCLSCSKSDKGPTQWNPLEVLMWPLSFASYAYLKPLNTESRNGFAEICNRNNKLDVHAVWMQMCVYVCGQWRRSRTSFKIVACIDSKHHSQGTAPRTLCPDAQMRNVLWMWLPQGFPSDKSTAQMICQWKILRPNTRKMATQWQYVTYAISFPFNPTGKQIPISNKQEKIDYKQQSWLRFMESETRFLSKDPPTDNDYKGHSLL